MTTQSVSPESFAITKGKTACFLIHGFTGDTLDLYDLGEFLADHNYSVRADLLPGHGTNSKDLKSVNHLQWITAVSDSYQEMRKRFDRVFVLGLSMGGSLALYLAEQFSLPGVITLSAPVQLRRWQIRSLPVIGAFTDTIIKGLGIGNGHYSGYDRYPVQSTKELVRLLGKIRTNLHKVESPVRIFHSIADRVVSVQNAYAIAREISSEDVHMKLYRKSGHLLATDIEKDRVFNDILNELHDFELEQTKIINV